MPRVRSGLVFDPRFLLHDTGTESTVVTRSGSFELSAEPHPSAASITRRIKEFLDGVGLTAQMFPVPARAATENELATYHTHDYIAGIRACAGGGPKRGPWGEVDEETVLSPESFEAALYAAGGAMNAVSAVMDRTVHNAYALLRPPCHHATRNQALGFCIFNNTVLAAQHARNAYGLERIMIIDWDVHHGNGTQDAFYGDAGVLFVSLHQQNWFPHLSGALEQVGAGAGAGYTVNIPLPPGTGDKGYLAAFAQIVLPIGLQFQPQLIILTAGQDASWLDPLARMMITMDGYRQMAQLMVDLAEEVCAGRLVMLQAGGYSAPYVPYCTVAAVEPLVGADLGIVDLYDNAPELERCQTIFSRDTQEALTAARSWHRRFWKL
ncbi:MAG TPA: class II histone deacetylase [Ktedonobacteraceae bacterium]|jgi:acetoin utilization deacetylase AcuC-like enzyme|nr:class II histone deacetylase [Ktedonobacteraceae bacterium]